MDDHQPIEIWRNRIDNKYDVYVERVLGDAYKGILKVDLEGNNLFSKDVSISYGGPFGPDAGDVNQWADWACEFVDSLTSKDNAE